VVPVSINAAELPDLYRAYLAIGGLEAVACEVYRPYRLKYFSRLEAVAGILDEEFPVRQGIRLGDFGCGLGIISRALSGLGYGVLAIDTDADLIAGLRAADPGEGVEWVASNIEDLDYPDGFLDAAIAIEVVEHCAHPEDIVEKIFRFVKPGGILIVTTPNGSRLGAGLLLRLPSFERVRRMGDRGALEARQFSADLHLLRFKLQELAALVPPDGELVARGYFGVSGVLFNRLTYYLLRLFPIKTVIALNERLPRVPILNRLTASKVYAVIRKSGGVR
jgi:2-polyprenyl-3-methyl-5-hydroxy-6-metoxy-1,4-benzoquinol methylase